jgi:predicted phage terminase large subunit-like protein
LFNRVWFPIVDAVPWGGVECRFWDLAASTKKGSDFTAGVKIRRIRDAYFVTDMIAVQAGPSDIDQLMFNTAIADNQSARESATGYAVRWEIEGGASGVRDDHRLREMLRAFDCGGIRPQGDKLVRAKPLAAASHQGNVRLLQGHWNEEWLTHMHHQPDWSHDDIMDASTGAYNALSATMTTTEEVVQMPWVSIGPQL